MTYSTESGTAIETTCSMQHAFGDTVGWCLTALSEQTDYIVPRAYIYIYIYILFGGRGKHIVKQTNKMEKDTHKLSLQTGLCGDNLLT